MTGSADERLRRWRLALGVDGDNSEVPLGPDDRRLDAALGALYEPRPGKKGRGGLGGSTPRVSRWLGDIREYFPVPVVQVIQRDAFERLGLRQMLLQPELLSALEADVHLVADLVSLGSAIPDETRETARAVVAKVVDELMQRLEQRVADAVRGALARSRRTRRPRPRDIDWPRTLAANLHHYQPALGTVVPERLVGNARRARAQVDLEEVVLCIDQSASMATSVVYSALFAAVMASLPGVDTRLVAFDTAVVDLTDKLADPVDVLFGVQLGGGTDIHQAVSYCERLFRQPRQGHLVLVTDLYEGGDEHALLARLGQLRDASVNVIVLLALDDEGESAHDEALAAKVMALGCPVFACTPDEFPELMAVALRRDDVADWVAARDARGAAGA